MSNPGPATTITTNYPLVINQNAQGTLVLKGLSVSTAGDTVITVPNLFGGSIVPISVITTNANVTMATATVGLYTAPAAGGTAILTTAALTGQTTTAFAYVRAATAAAAQVAISGNVIYANVGTTVAGGTVDLYLTFINVS